MPPTLLRGPEGQTVSADDDAKAAEYLSRGFVPYGEQHLAGDVAEEVAKPEDRGVIGSLNAAATAGLSGLTLGTSDVLLSSMMTDNERDRVLQDRRANPTISAVSEVAGNVLPALVSGGALTPAGAISRVGQGIAARGAEGGAARAIASQAAGAAVEGAAQMGGSYLAQSALENKDLSAEAFLGEMGKGALFGGAVGGALGVGEKALVRARALFPKSEITREAAQAVERDAVDAIRGAMDDGEAMQGVVTQQLEAMKLQAAQERLAAGAVPNQTIVDEIAPGRVNWAIDRAEQAAARRPRRAFEAAAEGSPTPGDSAGAAGEPLSWREFQAQRMAGAMREEGGHAGAMKRIGKEWKEYKARVDAPAHPPPPPRTATADRAVFDLAPPGQPVSRTVPWQEIEAGRAAAPEAVAVDQAATSAGRRPRPAAAEAPPLAPEPPPSYAMEATHAGRPGARRSAADEILAPRQPVDIDEALRRVARAGNFDLAPALEPVVPRHGPAITRGSAPPPRAAALSLEDQLQAMAKRADAGVPLREMRPSAAIPDEAIAGAGKLPAGRQGFGEIEAERIGRPSEGRLEMRIRRPGSAEPIVVSGKRDVISEALEKAMPDGFRPAEALEPHRAFRVKSGIPSHGEISDNALYVVRPSEFVERGNVFGNVLNDANRDAVLQRWSHGERLDPLRVDVTPEGRMIVDDGNHRLQAAAQTDRPVLVKFKPVQKQGAWQEDFFDITDRVRAELPRQPTAAPAKIPEYSTMKSQLDKTGEDYIEQVIPAREIADRGYYEPAGRGRDQVKAAKAEAAIRDGQRDPILLTVSPEGKIVVDDGRHRLAAAIEQGRDIRVKWTNGFEPSEHDVFRAGAGSSVDDAVAAAVPPREALADAADEVLARSNPKAAKILDAARKERATRAEVEALFNGQAAPGAETAVGRRAAPAAERPAVSKTVPWQEIEAARLRGELPAEAIAPKVDAPPAPTFEELVSKPGARVVEQKVAADEIAQRGWYDAESVRARHAFGEDIWAKTGDAALDPKKLEAARRIVRSTKGGREVFDLAITPDGHIILQSGVKPEEFQAALEAGGAIKARWSPWTEWIETGAPKADDVMQPFQDLAQADVERWARAVAGGEKRSLREFMDGSSAAPGAGQGAEVAAEIRRALGDQPRPGGWIPVHTPEGEVIGAAPILEESAPRTVAGRKAARQAPAVDEMIAGRQAPVDVDEQIATALGRRVGHMVPMGDDIAAAAEKISSHEEALAELAEALGEAAPASAVERATKLRAAQAAHADGAGAAQANAAQRMADNSHTIVEQVNSARVNAVLDADAARTAKESAGAVTPTAAAGRNLGALADIGAGLEVLKALGVPVPDVTKIPVIGPVLGMYLKARAALGIWKRAGGAVPQSLEGLIASKGAKTQDRAAAAVRKMLDLGTAGIRKVQPAAPGIGALGYRLFPGGPQRKSESADPVANYHARMDELARAAQPGAIERAVDQRLPTSDPKLRQALIDGLRRKLSYVDSLAPRPPLVPAMLKGDGEWRPSKERLAIWARHIAAAEDPAGVLEQVAAGRGVSVEAAETLRQVYPALFSKAQEMLLQAAPNLQGAVPYARRVSLRVLFQVPTDPTTTPEHVRFLQQGSQAAPGGSAPAGAGQGSPTGSPPTPTIASPMAIGDRTMSRLDQRAGR